MTGINPFIPPTYRRITPIVLLKAILMLPIYLLYKLGCVSIKRVIRIKGSSNTKLFRKINANCVTCYDKEIIEAAFIVNGMISFPEGTNTNNRALLQYTPDSDCVVGLIYSPECIYITGNRLKWLVRFLGSSPTVKVECSRGKNLEDVTGLTKVKFTKEDKIAFNKKLLE